MGKSRIGKAYQIESGIPIPDHGSLTPLGHVLKQLKPGQSTWAEVSLSTAQRHAREHLGRGKFVAREVDGGVRVWRKKR
jgi:hypothetical protein